jgi:hypothetical protein
MEIAIVGLNATLDRAPVEDFDRAMMALPIGMGKSEKVPDMNGINFPITARAMAETASMISLVREANATNYWSDNRSMSEVKKQKAREKKRWAKIRRKQGR